MRKRKIGLMGRRALYGYLFIMPFIIGFIFLMVRPLFGSLRMALSQVTISTQGFSLEANQFANFKRAFLVDPDFNQLLLTGIGNMIYRSIATIVFSFFVALLLNQNFKGRTFARSIFFLAVILSSGVLLGLENNNALMAQLKNAIEETGNVNTVTEVLERILVSDTTGFSGISGKTFEKVFEIIDSIYDVAMASGIQIIIFLSGLQNISPSMYEAAQMEGCTSWESMCKITIPMVSPLLPVCWVYTIVDFFMKTDNEIMTKINNSLQLMEYGFSAAMAWSYFVVCMILIGVTSFIISKVVYDYD
ncbi:MAG: sugar ABC transporter permease [Treponema sp.]|nr:sugar ABC transporter permease [Treponema sp.]